MMAGGWLDFRDRRSFCTFIGISLDELAQAEHESSFNYIEYTRKDRRSGKKRDLCYPPPGSLLQKVQQAIKVHVLARVPLAAEIRGYRRGQHNILVAAEISGAVFEGRLDISSFHPSITDGHVADALAKHGFSPPWARRIARLVTFRSRRRLRSRRPTVPQGAPTSSHVANIVLDPIFRRSILPCAAMCGVVARNYGDDIAFVGASEQDVRACVRHAARAIRRAGFSLSAEKTVEAEHLGGRRWFIGCATGRPRVDYPRTKYRALRAELRSLLCQLRTSAPGEASLSAPTINSLRQRIAYVGRLNRHKARRLFDIFHRICAQSRRLRLGRMPDAARGAVA